MYTFYFSVHLRLCDAKRVEEFGVFDRQLDDLLDLFDLLVQAADVLIRWVGHFLDHHKADERIDLLPAIQCIIRFMSKGMLTLQHTHQHISMQLIWHIDVICRSTSNDHNPPHRCANHTNTRLNSFIWREYLIWKYLVKCVAVAAQCNTTVRRDVVDVDVLVQVDDKFSLWMNLSRQKWPPLIYECAPVGTRTDVKLNPLSHQFRKRSTATYPKQMWNIAKVLTSMNIHSSL